MSERLIDFRGVKDRTGFGKSWTYKLISEGRFPKPIKLGRTSRWIQSQVDGFIDAQIQASRDPGAAP